MFRRCLALLLPCLLLAACAPRLSAPVMSAELQTAFEQGPLCQRLNGVMWPCSDTDGRLWKEWYAERQKAEHAANMQAIQTAGLKALGAALLIGAVGGLAYGLHRSSGHSHSHYNHSITTSCYYGRYSSSCTTRY